MRIFDLLGIKNSDKFMLENDESSDNFTGESGMRIFILLGSKKLWGIAILLESKLSCWRVSSRLWGKSLFLFGKSLGVWVVCQSTGD